MDNETKLKTLLSEYATTLGMSLKPEEIVIDHSKDPSHGDYSTNFALRYAKGLGSNPRELASKLAESLHDEIIEKIEIKLLRGKPCHFASWRKSLVVQLAFLKKDCIQKQQLL